MPRAYHACSIWKYCTSWFQPLVPRVEDRTKHGFEKKTVAHPLTDQDIHAFLWDWHGLIKFLDHACHHGNYSTFGPMVFISATFIQITIALGYLVVKQRRQMKNSTLGSKRRRLKSKQVDSHRSRTDSVHNKGQLSRKQGQKHLSSLAQT